MKLISYISGAILALGSQGALAQNDPHPGGFYAGIGAGSSEIDEGVGTGLITSGTLDNEDDGSKLFAGFQFSRNVAIEVAWVDLGNFSYSGDFLGVPVTSGDVDVVGLNGSLVGIWPLSEHFELFGKLGAYAWEVEARDSRAGASFGRDTDGTDISAGVGANFYFADHVGVRVEAERFELDDDKADLVSASLLVRF